MIVDTKNEFNEINQVVILWTFHYFWSSGDCFVFNCYFNWSLLCFWNGNGAARFLHSREGVTQGGPPEIIVYGIGILLLIKKLKR